MPSASSTARVAFMCVVAFLSSCVYPPPCGANRSEALQQVAVELLHRPGADQRHRAAHVGLEESQHVVDASLAGGAEGVEVGATDQRRLRAESNGLHHIAPTADAAVDEHLGPVADGVDHRRHEMDGGRRTVELATAV